VFCGRFVTEHEDVDECRNRRGELHDEDDGEAAEQDSDDRHGQERDEGREPDRLADVGLTT
jgi:hypothetical protein